jgi:outer membrane protein assembly factor BamB
MNDAPRDFSNGPVWTYQTGASIMGSFAVDNGKVFVGSGDQYIYALDAYNGSEIWKFKTNQPLNVEWGSTCAVYGGVVITGGDDGFVYGLDENTGKQLWKVDVGPYINVRDGLGQHNIRSSPMIYQGVAYIGSFNNKTYAIDPLTGATKWTSDLGATIIGSAAFDYNGSMYIETMTNRIFKLSLGTDPTGPAAGTIQLNFTVNTTPIGQAFAFGESSHTPSISLDGKWVMIGGIGNLFEAYWTSNGTLVSRIGGPSVGGVPNWFNIQPHVLAENSHGAMCVVPVNMLSPTNQTLSSPTLPNGTVWSGIPLTYVNSTSANPAVGGPQVAAYGFYKGQYTFNPATTYGASGTYAYATNQSYIIGQAGPTVICTLTNIYNVTSTVPGMTGNQQVRIANPGDNIWSDWGGWEVWSSPIMASFGTNALVFYGSESYAIHCVNASNGVPLTWWTTAGAMGSSPAIYDGKLYCGSAEGKVYCFEEHQTTQTTTTASVDNTSPNAGQAVNVTVKVASVPTINVYQEIGQAAPVPSIPSQQVTVTFIKPDGTTVVDVPATTDTYGNVVVSYTPDVGGNWQVVAAYNGIMGPRETYAKSASDVIALTVGGSTATSTPTASETPSGTATPSPVSTVAPTVAPSSSTGNNPTDNTLIYAAIAVVVIVVIVLAALVLMRRKK